MSEILFLPQEYKIHMFELSCNGSGSDVDKLQLQGLYTQRSDFDH